MRPTFGWLAPMAAGFVAVLIGFASSAVIVYQAAIAMGATTEQFGSWIFSLALGMAVLSAGLSWRYRDPVVIAWSTPGAALLASALTQATLAEAIGAFMFSALLMIVVGATGWFERVMKQLPLSLASGLLAGILLRFGLDIFSSLQSRFGLVGGMLLVYVIGRRLAPRYVVILVLIAGVSIAAMQDLLQLDGFALALARPTFVMPAFSLSAIISIGIPLFVVTMASQNVPGVAVMRAFGYQTPVSPCITACGAVTLVLAPFGAYAVNLAAITAAICMGREAHEDPRKRYQAAIWQGGFSLLFAIFGATVALVFAAFPKELVMALAGIALLGAIGQGFAAAMADQTHREAALITFLVTASGLTLGGIGSAFWGLVAGAIMLLAQGGAIAKPSAPLERKS